ncbi:MAG: aldose 1-epimerase family protein [Clostridiales bacterium]|nr:aldose 1-epimerase family protein [Clostridiales bacterium]
MAIFEISNGRLTVAVDSRGAELKSLRKSESGKEYMWCADARYWGRTSPTLFPLVGGLKEGQYRFNGKTYYMQKHGFIRDKEFKLMSHEATEVWFILESDDETFEIFPFRFRLRIGYRLEGMTLKVLWRVENPSDETIYFSIGGHPAFNCPINRGEKREDCFLRFDKEDAINCTVIGEDGLAGDERRIYELRDGLLPITEELFERDAIIMEDYQVHSISLLTPDKKAYLTTRFELPVVAVWAPAGKNAPFICIEPWHGICDHTDFRGSLQERKWGNAVEPGKCFASGYEITVEE